MRKNPKRPERRTKTMIEGLLALLLGSGCILLGGGCDQDVFEPEPELVAKVGGAMLHESHLSSAAADAAMRKKLSDPTWQRPRGYVWQHAGGPDSTVYELVDRRFNAAVALSCEFPAPREIARPAKRVSPAAGHVEQGQIDDSDASAHISAPGRGTHLIQTAYDQFCIERFPRPSEVDVSAFEQKIGIVFPDAYRRFLLQFNGGYFKEPEIETTGRESPHDVLTFLCGFNSSHEEAELGGYLPLFSDNVPPKVFPIGGTALGSLIVLDTAAGLGRGAIFIKPAFGDYYGLADDLPAFFTLLRKQSND